MTRIAYLDGWRGCAVLAVLTAHFFGTRYINLGRFGVELFFVLSGRLMAEILFVRAAALPQFYLRRFSRVYPALIIFAAAMFALARLRGSEPTGVQTLTALSFTSNYANAWTGRSGALDHIWSLCVEEHMYLLLGLIAFFHRRWALPLIPIFAALALAAIANGVLQTLDGHDYYAVYWHSDVRGASLLLGVLAYLLLHERVPHWLSWRWMPAVCGIAGLLLSFHGVPDPVKYSLGSGLLALALVLAPQAPPRALRLLEHPMLLQIGVWSYSLYLWQQPFAKLGGPLPMKLVYLAAVFGLALISFYPVEKPARRTINRLATAGSPRIAV